VESNQSNRLGAEKSPYLLQHKNNPIAWYAWGERAFADARALNKPIFLSIGYSTCHWCHVMAHESFEDQDVAEVLNKNFISIKLDREERPDIDDLYMKAVQALTGGGGWPMSVWLTPEGRPFFAGTYFPKHRFLQLLRRIEQLWSDSRDQLLADGDRLLETIQRISRSDGGQTTPGMDEMEEFLQCYTNHFQHHFDERHGGFGGAPKFPQSMNLMVMMRQDAKTATYAAESMVKGTLDGMIRGGIYDHLAGGFHRYSVDERWLVPHFEKMLYDQALLSVTLLEAQALYKEEEFGRAARETLDYVLREMTHPEGGFYSAQDADSLNPQTGHVEEGHFATYVYSELKDRLSPTQLDLLTRVYGVTPEGQFEGRNILYLQKGFSRTTRNANPELREALSVLSEIRASRPAPHLDDKVIASWNGWMAWALARAGLYLGEPLYTVAAEKALRFIKQKMFVSGRLSRFWRDGETRSSATAEDYASLINACVELYQSGFNEEWADWALTLQNVMDRDFWDIDEGGYYAADGRDHLVPLRHKDDYDGVTPGANSMAALNLVRLYSFTGERRFLEKAETIMNWLFPRLREFPSSLAFLAVAIDLHLSSPRVAVVSGNSWAREVFWETASGFSPHLLWAKADSSSVWPVARDKESHEPRIYVCTEGRCLKPATDKSSALEQLE
jgi:uncharacterized protein YyaL (SSP411 family)